MTQLLIADSDNDTREKVSAMLTQAGYNVIVSNSVANVLDDALKRRAEVIIVGQDCDNMGVGELVHLLKQCNRDVPIILVSGDQPLSVLRKVRSEGIFYHARKSFEPDARQELLEAVRCALKNFLRTQNPCNSY